MNNRPRSPRWALAASRRYQAGSTGRSNLDSIPPVARGRSLSDGLLTSDAGLTTTLRATRHLRAHRSNTTSGRLRTAATFATPRLPNSTRSPTRGVRGGNPATRQSGIGPHREPRTLLHDQNQLTAQRPRRFALHHMHAALYSRLPGCPGADCGVRRTLRAPRRLVDGV